MEIIPQAKIVVSLIATELHLGKIIIYPTETCYGLGCDVFNPGAVEKIFRIKGREPGKPMLMLASDIEEVKNAVVWNDTLEKLALDYWPGPLTIVAVACEPKRWPVGILGADNTLAFRVSSHPFAGALIKNFGGPIVSTSANLAGQKNAYDIGEIVETIGRGAVQPDILIDAGDLSPEPPSTIVCVVDEKIKILRQGSIQLH